MIEVFKTDVGHPADARNLVFRLLGLYPNGGITFDLEDCDKVLRVECASVCPKAVISLMEAAGFSCEILS